MTNYEVLMGLKKETLAGIIGNFLELAEAPCYSCPCKGYSECNINCKTAWLSWLEEEAISFSDTSDDIEKWLEQEVKDD